MATLLRSRDAKTSSNAALPVQKGDAISGTPVTAVAMQALESMPSSGTLAASEGHSTANHTSPHASAEPASRTIQDRVLPALPAEPESPSMVLLLGQFVGTDMPGWAQWETLAWGAQWQDADGLLITCNQISRLDFSGSWTVRVPPGPVSIVCHFILDNSSPSFTVAEVVVSPSDGEPNYPIPRMLQGRDGPFASEFVSIDLTGRLSVDQLVVAVTPGLRCERPVGILENPRWDYSKTIEPDADMRFFLVSPPTGLDYAINIHCDGLPERRYTWVAQAGCRVLQINYPE